MCSTASGTNCSAPSTRPKTASSPTKSALHAPATFAMPAPKTTNKKSSPMFSDKFNCPGRHLKIQPERTLPPALPKYPATRTFCSISPLRCYKSNRHFPPDLPHSRPLPVFCPCQIITYAVTVRETDPAERQLRPGVHAQGHVRRPATR